MAVVASHHHGGSLSIAERGRGRGRDLAGPAPTALWPNESRNGVAAARADAWTGTGAERVKAQVAVVWLSEKNLEMARAEGSEVRCARRAQCRIG